jgi:ABC-type transport system involved in cytochrome c biogenesis permease subunit
MIEVRQKNKEIFLVTIFFVIFFLYDFETGFFWTLFLSFIAFRWDERVAGVLGLFSLATCPLLLYLELPDVAEQMAIYAFFFLVMTVVLQIIQLSKESWIDDKTPILK